MSHDVIIPRGPDDPAGLFNQPMLINQGVRAYLHNATLADWLTLVSLLAIFGLCAWVGLKSVTTREYGDD